MEYASIGENDNIKLHNGGDHINQDDVGFLVHKENLNNINQVQEYESTSNIRLIWNIHHIFA